MNKQKMERERERERECMSNNQLVGWSLCMHEHEIHFRLTNNNEMFIFIIHIPHIWLAWK